MDEYNKKCLRQTKAKQLKEITDERRAFFLWNFLENFCQIHIWLKKWVDYSIKLWRNDFSNNVSANQNENSSGCKQMKKELPVLETDLNHLNDKSEDEKNNQPEERFPWWRLQWFWKYCWRNSKKCWFTINKQTNKSILLKPQGIARSFLTFMSLQIGTNRIYNSQLKTKRRIRRRDIKKTFSF